MAKPNKGNRYLKDCVESATVGQFTFCLMETGSYMYIVRVFPHEEDLNSFWLDGGPWETYTGCKASILNFLSDQE